MNRRNLLILSIVVAAILGPILALTVYSQWYVMGSQETEVFFRVTDGKDIGFAADTDRVHFGKVARGGGAWREIVLRSDANVVAHITVSQNIEGWVIPKNTTVYLRPGEHIRLDLDLKVPRDAPAGNYTGAMRVSYFRRLPWQG